MLLNFLVISSFKLSLTTTATNNWLLNENTAWFSEGKVYLDNTHFSIFNFIQDKSLY